MDQTNPAASSPAEATDPFNGQTPTLAEFNTYRQSGELPERFRPAEPAEAAPAETSSESTDESAAESEAADTHQEQEPQRKGPQTARERIAHLSASIEKLWEADEPDTVRISQLEATIDKIKERAGIKRSKTEAAPVAQQPQQAHAEPQQQGTRSKPTPDGKGPDGQPYKDYEAYLEDLADWKAEEKIARFQQQQAEQAQRRELLAKVEEGKTLYGDDFADLADETAGAIGQDPQIPLIVKQRFGRSDILPHLTYTIGSDPQELNKFVRLAKTDPFKALDYIAVTETAIREELAKGKEEKPSGKALEKPRTQAPKPPEPVGGTSSRGFDVSDESLSADEWMRKRNKQLGKG